MKKNKSVIRSTVLTGIVLLAMNAFAWTFNEECDTLTYDTCQTGPVLCTGTCLIVSIPNGVCNTVYGSFCRDAATGIYVTATATPGKCSAVEFPLWCNTYGNSPITFITSEACSPFFS